MGFLRKIGSFFGISRDDADHPDSPSSAAAAAAAELPHDRAAAAAAAHGARRGFSVQVPVPVERQGPGPVLVPCPQGDGGVQVPPGDSFPLCDDGVGCTCAPESTGSGFMERAPFFFFFLWCLWCAVALVSGSSEVWTWTCWDGSLNSGGSSSRSELLIAGLEDFS